MVERKIRNRASQTAEQGRAAIMRWTGEMLTMYDALSAEERESFESYEQWRDAETRGTSEWPGFVAKIGPCPWGGHQNGRRRGK